MKKILALAVMTLVLTTKTEKVEDTLVIPREPIPYEQEMIDEEILPKAPVYRIEVTEDDIDLMARVVMSEASILEMDGKVAVACTIVNRVLSDKFPDSVRDVVYQKNQYSTADNGEPNRDCYRAVFAVLEYESFPLDMFYFRTDHPHSFGHWYFTSGNTYFSTEGINE